MNPLPDDDEDGNMIEAIGSASVLTIFFVRVGHSLILDLRTDHGESPAVLLDMMVGTPRERLLSFRRLRPNLPLPDEITLAPWPDRVRDFEELGMLDAMRDRLREAGGEELARSGTRIYRQLAAMEREMLRELVRGVGLQTIWQRTGDDAVG